MCLNHLETIPPLQSMEKLSSTTTVPGTKRLGTTGDEDWVLTNGTRPREVPCPCPFCLVGIQQENSYEGTRK